MSRLESLQLANEIRSRRAELKRALAAGETNISRVLADPPWYARSMTIEQLLLACPGLGPQTANRALIRLRISPTRQVQRLTETSRVALLVDLRSRRPQLARNWNL